MYQVNDGCYFFYDRGEAGPGNLLVRFLLIVAHESSSLLLVTARLDQVGNKTRPIRLQGVVDFRPCLRTRHHLLPISCLKTADAQLVYGVPGSISASINSCPPDFKTWYIFVRAAACDFSTCLFDALLLELRSGPWFRGPCFGHT